MMNKPLVLILILMMYKPPVRILMRMMYKPLVLILILVYQLLTPFCPATLSTFSGLTTA